MQAPLPQNENKRIETVRQYDILDTASEPEFDDLTHLAAQICDTPMASITLVDEHRQWFKSKIGIEVTETPREVSFCAHTILQNDLLQVVDATKDERFADNPLVMQEPHVRFYAGVPLVSPEGYSVGSLCVIDTVPRQLDESQVDALRRLGRQVVTQLEARPTSSLLKKQSRLQRYEIEQRERENTADLIKTSQARYQSLFEITNDGIIILDSTTRRITTTNSSLMKLLGLQSEEILGRELWEIGLFAEKSAADAALSQLEEKGSWYQAELPIQIREDVHDVEIICRAQEEDGQKIFQCNVRDASERKDAERQMHFQAHLLDVVGEAIVATDLEDRIIYWNRFAEELYGWRAGEAAGCNGTSLLKPHVADEHTAQNTAQTPQIKAWLGDIRVQHRDGFSLAVSVTNSPIYDDGGALLGYVTVSRDISERQQAETNLRDSEERFRLLLESVQDYAIYMLDPQGYVTSWNSGAQRLKGYTANEIIGQHFSRFYLPQDVANGKDKRALEIAASEGRFEEEGQRMRKNGESFWANVSLTAIRDESGVLRGFSKVTRDITERKLAQQSLERTNREIVTVWESMTDAFFILDTSWIITYANEQTAILWRKKREEVLGENLWELFPEAVHTKFFAQYQRAMKDQVAVVFEEFYPPLDVWREVHAYPSSVGLSVYFRDVTERRVAEETLRQSEALFQSIVANAPGMVYQFVLRPDGTTEIPFVNEGCRRLLEMTPEEVKRNGAFMAQFIEPSYLAEWQISIIQSAASLSPWEWEGRIKLNSGKVKWVQGTSRPRRLKDGGTLWEGLVTDITARKQAEEERDRFFTLSLDMLCIIDTRGFFRRLNPAFEEILGYTQAELMAKSLLDFVHPEDLSATRVELQNLLLHESPQQFVNRFRCRDGSYKWLSWRSTPYEGLNYAAARDITALKHAEEELQRANADLELRVAQRTGELALANEELHMEMRERQRAVKAQQESYNLLQAVIEGSTDSIYVKDLEGHYLMINSAGANRFGKTPEQLIGQTDENLLLPELLHIVQEADHRVLETQTTYTFEQTRKVSGNEQTQSMSKGIYRNPQGEVAGIVGTARDITEQKQQADALRAAKEEADAANLAKSEFLSRMSHELRTPLNAILGFGQILEMHSPGMDDRAAITQILKGGWHLLNLVNEVLDISRVEAGHIELLIEPVALVDVISESCAMVRPLADKRDILIEENAGHFCELHVLADRQRIKQVLINLLSNAIKYNHDGGVVEVFCDEMPNRNLRIGVRDTGPGLSREDQQKLFTPFERLTAANSGIEGSGLGLALSQGLMNAMQGKIGVESESGNGSTFWIELSGAQSPRELSSSLSEIAEPESMRTTGHTYTVLSIEDNLSNLWLIEAILSHHPHITLLAAMQGSIGLDIARQHIPDLVLLDLNLPDISGAEVLAQLRASPSTSHIPVIVVSADATSSQIERLLRAGAQHYLTKPLDVTEFLKTINETLSLNLTPPGPDDDGPTSESLQSPTVDSAPPPAPRILVVEDNAINQQVVLHQLRFLGHEAVVVDNGQSAVEVWQQGDFSAIFMDCNLPIMDGYEATREIRRQEQILGKRHIPIVALTATDSEADQKKCLAAGMDDYLSKPTRQADLSATLARWTSAVPNTRKAVETPETEVPVVLRERWTELQDEMGFSFLQELAKLFLRDTVPDVEDLKAAVYSNSKDDVRKLAHKIKGSCATIGMERMTRLCRGMEVAATSTAGEIPILLERVLFEFEKAKIVIKEDLYL